MLSTDPIADMLTRLRNAMAVGKTEVMVPHSKVKENVASVLASSGYVEKVELVDGVLHKQIKITVYPDASTRINTMERLSKPGRRVYVKCDTIPKVKQGRGIIIISTSQGIMTGEQAKQKRLGGELICQVY